MRVWRICKEKYAASAFSGEGARLFEARWNFAGTPMVYTSSSLALAAMEFFIHLDPTEAPPDLISAAADVPDHLEVERLVIQKLPKDWRRVDHEALQRRGTNWAKSRSSVALLVPSAAIESEWNVLLNPLHPGFVEIKPSAAKPFRFDERMFKSAP